MKTWASSLLLLAIACDRERSHCFEASARIATVDGPRAISEIEAGDLVWSSALDGPTLSRVITTRQSVAKRWRVIRGEQFTFRSTPSHPVFVVDLGEFVPAEEVKAGMTVTVLRGGMVSRDIVLNVADETREAEKAYDLMVESGNYFAFEVLVHNKTIHCQQPVILETSIAEGSVLLAGTTEVRFQMRTDGPVVFVTEPDHPGRGRIFVQEFKDQKLERAFEVSGTRNSSVTVSSTVSGLRDGHSYALGFAEIRGPNCARVIDPSGLGFSVASPE